MKTMIDYINECNGCADGCHGCGKNHELVTLCDECGEPTKTLYELGGKEYCEDCITTMCDEFYSDLTLTDKMMMFGWDLDEYQTLEGAEADANNYWDGLELTDKISFKEDFT